jgi:hypothetical protein
MPHEAEHAAPSRFGENLRGQPGLADAGFTRDHHERPAPGNRGVEPGDERRPLRIPSDEREPGAAAAGDVHCRDRRDRPRSRQRGEVAPHVGRPLVTIGGSLGQEAPDDDRHRRRDRAILREEDRRVADDRGQGRFRRRAPEGMPPGQELGQQDAEGEKVGPRVDVLS